MSDTPTPRHKFNPDCEDCVRERRQRRSRDPLILRKRDIALVRGAMMRALDWTEGSIQSSSGDAKRKEERVFKRYHTFLKTRLNQIGRRHVR